MCLCAIYDYTCYIVNIDYHIYVPTCWCDVYNIMIII